MGSWEAIADSAPQLFGQLAERGMRVIPVLLEPEKLPAILQPFKYINMTSERFEGGFIELRRTLAARRRKAD
jgi:hypothetical protein